jgi:hypothetical protein
MSFNFLDQGFDPSDSYSRKLDRRVAMDEYPYGYEGEVPPAGHKNGTEGLINDEYKNTPLKPQKQPWKEMK